MSTHTKRTTKQMQRERQTDRSSHPPPRHRSHRSNLFPSALTHLGVEPVQADVSHAFPLSVQQRLHRQRRVVPRREGAAAQDERHAANGCCAFWGWFVRGWLGPRVLTHSDKHRYIIRGGTPAPRTHKNAPLDPGVVLVGPQQLHPQRRPLRPAQQPVLHPAMIGLGRGKEELSQQRAWMMMD